MVKVKDRWIHFGDKRYQHFKDSTPLKYYSDMNHNDKNRQLRYFKRALKIKDKDGNLTKDNKLSPNYYSLRYLWGFIY